MQVQAQHLLRLKLIFFVFFFVLILRSLQLAITTNSRYAQLAENQFHSTFVVQGPRGEIIDQQERPLAVSVQRYSAFINTRALSNKKIAAQKIGKIIGVPASSVLAKIKTDKYFAWLKRFITPEEHLELKALKQYGIAVQFSQEFKRLYPNPYLLSSVLGFVSTDGQGLSGLELKMNKLLKSESHKIRMKVDGRGQPILIHEDLLNLKNKVNSIQLTLDSSFQSYVEEKLEQTVQKFSARRGLVVAMDPHSGAIKAMAQFPRFDSNQYEQYSKEIWKNLAVAWNFEPGSVFKPIALSYGLEQKLFGINESINCREGSFAIGKYVVKEADTKHQYENLKVWEIIQKSSNIGTSQLSTRFHPQQFFEFLKKFGFGHKIANDFAGEEKGILSSPKNWNKLTLSNLSFGQALSATPLQLVRAYAAFANGGKLVQPHIISKVRTNRDAWVPFAADAGQAELPSLDPIIEPRTQQDMNKALFSVTQEGGTGTLAHIPEIGVAGKTGTAQRAWENRRGYEPHKYVSSFIGFAPVSGPASLVVGVFIDSPTPIYYGGVVAAPLFKMVMEQYLNQNGLISQLVHAETKQQWGHLNYFHVQNHKPKSAQATLD